MYNNDPKYMNPQQGLASLVNSPYGDSDVMRVKMTPREVAGLQQLAMSYGANQRDLYDPVTGEPRFSFLKKILPMIAGAILPGIPGVGTFAKTIGFGSQALGSALLVGGVTGLIEGDLKKGLMAGLGAYSGAKIGEGFTAAGKAASQVSTAPAPAASLKDTAFKISTDPVGQNLPLSSLREAPISTVTGKAMMPVQTVTQAPPMPTPTPLPAPTGFFGTMGQGARNLFASDATGDAARKAFGETFSNPLVRTAVIAGGLSAITPEQKPLNVPGMGEDTFYVPGGFNPLYGTGADQPYQLPGKYYKRTKSGVVEYNPWGPTGMAAGGMVTPDQYMNQQRSIPQASVPYPTPNQNYPLSTVVQANYAPNAPRGREVVGGYDAKIDPFTGEEKFADGGEIIIDDFSQRGDPTGVVPGATKPGDTVQNITRPVDPNVEANRKYVAELNKRAMQPAFTPYGSFLGGTGGLGGTNTPWTGTNPYGGPLTPPATGGQTTGGGGAGDVAAFLATQAGVNWLMQPGNPTALKTWIENGMKWDERPFFKAKQDATKTGTDTGETKTGETKTGETKTGESTTGTNTTTTTTTTGTDTSTFDPNVDYSKYTNVGGDLSSLSNILNSRGAIAGLESLGTLGGLSSTGFGGVLPATITPTGVSGLQSLSSGMAPSGSVASQYGGMKGALEAGAKSTALDTLQNKIIPGVGTALGAYSTAKAIEAGKEGQAALSAAGTAASAGQLFNIAALGGPAGMLAAAAIAAIGASLVNTKEYGDVALRNYWNAVDAGRGIGQTDPNELAQGFINFYRTNKNEFAGQEKYGRTGNEDFVYDMTQVINNAVKDGKVGKDVDPATMYKEVVQPWLNSMGSGPKDEKARAIQDFMMTDLINSFMQGKPISNAQVKGDKKYKIVSEKPVYAGTPTTPAATSAGANPFAGEERGTAVTTNANPFAGGERETTMPTGESETLEEFNPYSQRAASLRERMSRFQTGGPVGEDYNFGFAGGGMSEYKAGGKLLDGPGDGMSDSIPAVIRGKGVQRAALADGEFVVPADVVSHLGNGSTKAGAKKLYAMMDRVRQARTGSKRQAPAVKTSRLLPA